MHKCNLEILILRPFVERPINLFLELYLTQYDFCTLELHLSGLTGIANHPDMQKIQTRLTKIIRFGITFVSRNLR